LWQDGNVVKRCKSKNYPNGNSVTAQEKLKNKYEPAAPFMVKLDKQFRDTSLEKGQNPEVWITELECFCIRLDDMDSSISEGQFMIHVLNNLPNKYDLQLALLEKRNGDKHKPLLSLRFERLKIDSTKNE
jgi:hypothetical protein